MERTSSRMQGCIRLAAGHPAGLRDIDREGDGYSHDMADGFPGSRPALFASGDGRATFGGLRCHAVTAGPAA